MGVLDNPKTSNSNDAMLYVDQVEGWKLVDLMALNEALEAAQLCGHNRLVLVEADRKVSREGLSAIVGFVCRQCGAQTLLPTSKFSRTSPTGFQVNPIKKQYNLSSFYFIGTWFQSHCLH